MSPQERALFQTVAELLSSGQDVAQIAQSTDLQATFLEQLLLRDEFLEFFASESPAAFKIWKQARAEEQSSELVKSLAKANALRNFKALQRLADDPENNLKDAERAAILEKLLKMSGQVQDEAIVEVVKISAAHLAALRGAASEVD